MGCSVVQVSGREAAAWKRFFKRPVGVQYLLGCFDVEPSYVGCWITWYNVLF